MSSPEELMRWDERQMGWPAPNSLPWGRWTHSLLARVKAAGCSCACCGRRTPYGRVSYAAYPGPNGVPFVLCRPCRKSTPDEEAWISAWRYAERGSD